MPPHELLLVTSFAMCPADARPPVAVLTALIVCVSPTRGGNPAFRGVVPGTDFALSTYGKIHPIASSPHTAPSAGWPGFSPTHLHGPHLSPRLPDPTSDQLLPCSEPLAALRCPHLLSATLPLPPPAPGPGPVTSGSADRPRAFPAGPPAQRPLGPALSYHLLKTYSYFKASGSPPSWTELGAPDQPDLPRIMVSISDLLPDLGSVTFLPKASVSLARD